MGMQGGYGVTCKIEITGVLTAIVHILETDLPEFEKMIADATAHDSTGGYREYIASGLRQMNEFTMTLGWDKSAPTHAALVTAYNSDSSVNMSVQDPDGAEVISFAAHVTKLGRVSSQEEVYKCDVTIQPTGVPTIV